MRSSRAAYVVLRIFNKGNLCHRKGFMPYKVLLHRDFGAPNPTPADWHESLQSLKAVIYSLGRDGWTFPGAVIEQGRDDKFPGQLLYRLHGGTRKSPGLIAVQAKR
jgi:hypothetical protein